jgi:hypothetical protein
MSGELLVPTGAVHERLGLTKAPTVSAPVQGKRINIRRLNVKDASPAYGVWIDLHATLAWMKAKSEEKGGVAVLEEMITELAEVTL